MNSLQIFHFQFRVFFWYDYPPPPLGFFLTESDVWRVAVTVPFSPFRQGFPPLSSLRGGRMLLSFYEHFPFPSKIMLFGPLLRLRVFLLSTLKEVPSEQNPFFFCRTTRVLWLEGKSPPPPQKPFSSSRVARAYGRALALQKNKSLVASFLCRTAPPSPSPPVGHPLS